ncbi:unnamed protein product [Cuscuta epithymum]|uniref:C2H2-type domain-containing protein n=2 Tax=Cuscuta epithymum TaxID=186058 RepID=A0AAV0D159_9ASTE|nr:unnamed protein product [Cuscuta epithymum]
MMKDMKMMIHQPNNLQTALDNQENMSNVTSTASGEASVSSTNGGVGFYPQHYFANSTDNNNTMATQTQPQQQLKRKRNQPGNPDPDAEVVAMSPKSLMATNRFVCEICNKGFQRDQNLQLHRRGHNLPWKLKQRSSKDIVRKKVYVCPETSCVHHDPSRALGDLTGIKKHFSRKHGEKKWKCPKCSKRYAVQSDCKAHSKTCGTREYRCDCGTLFSRRDSFITHRAFCDALAEESTRAAIAGNHIFQPPPPPADFSTNQHDLPAAMASYSIKKEQPGVYSSSPGFNLRPEIPPWLLPCPAGPPPEIPSFFQDFQNPNAVGPAFPDFHPTAIGSAQFSATALLQTAAQMGATMTGQWMGPALVEGGAHVDHVSADQLRQSSLVPDHFGLNLSSRRTAEELSVNGWGRASVPAGAPSATGAPSGSFFQDVMNCFSSSDNNNNTPAFQDPAGFGGRGGGAGFLMGNSPKKEGGGGDGSGDEVTKDFLGLRPLSRSDIFSITDLVVNTSSDHHDHDHGLGQSQRPWQQT